MSKRGKGGDNVVYLPGTTRAPEYLLRDAAREDLIDVVIVARTVRDTMMILSSTQDAGFLSISAVHLQEVALSAVRGQIRGEDKKPDGPKGAA